MHFTETNFMTFHAVCIDALPVTAEKALRVNGSETTIYSRKYAMVIAKVTCSDNGQEDTYYLPCD